ncbi:MAG: hemin transporter hemin uptake protein [Methylotenera sp.]|nr:MAG: hemin transporter hemin uptake protein [Methylotenera sp.]
MDKVLKTQNKVLLDTHIEGLAIKQPIVQTLSSAVLFAGAKELVIAHAGQEYRLRQTSQGKLILTK